MITVGVDLAAQPANTAIAVLSWRPDGCRVSELVVGADDEAILEAIAAAAKVGLDCPVGWPDAFVEFVLRHRDGSVEVPDGVAGDDWRRPLANRLTDEVVREQFHLVPLSVSADRIARPAMRAAALLARLAAAGDEVDRSGAGRVVEAYPAASLKQWGLRHRSYKGATNLAALGALADSLTDAAPWLDLAAYGGLVRSSDHAFDAVVASLTARAAMLGHTLAPTALQVAIARREGWIAVPVEPLDRLAPASPAGDE